MFSAGATALVFASGAAGVLLGTAAGLASCTFAGALFVSLAGLAEEEHEFSLFPQVIVELAE